MKLTEPEAIEKARDYVTQTFKWTPGEPELVHSNEDQDKFVVYFNKPDNKTAYAVVNVPINGDQPYDDSEDPSYEPSERELTTGDDFPGVDNVVTDEEEQYERWLDDHHPKRGW